MPSLSRNVANTIREEIDFGEAIVRRTSDEFVVLLAGRSGGEIRALGERICAEMRRHPLPGTDGHGVSAQGVQSAVRIASVVHAVAVTLEQA